MAFGVVYDQNQAFISVPKQDTETKNGGNFRPDTKINQNYEILQAIAMILHLVGSHIIHINKLYLNF